MVRFSTRCLSLVRVNQDETNFDNFPITSGCVCASVSISSSPYPLPGPKVIPRIASHLRDQKGNSSVSSSTQPLLVLGVARHNGRCNRDGLAYS